MEIESEERIKHTLDSTPVVARAVSVYNITENKKVYGKNDDVSIPIASLVKIINVVVALNNHSKNEIVYLSPDSIKQAGDYGLFADEKWKIEDLARLTLISSANDGAFMLGSSENFLEKINTKTQKLGAEASSFFNTTGLDIDISHPGAFATALDVNIMAMYALRAYPEIFNVTTQPEITLTSESGFTHTFKNTNIILDKIPNLILSKTGYTDAGGGSLAVIFKDQKGDDIAVTVLESTFEGRFTDMETLVNVLYNL